ncbi:3-deoxy-D-manno-octulosonate 8-phosphate phosphatase [hydrothermal vent metagenome]|uniref:3-deoxy-D-manno-octulosonate 8-phosphate phosphatase n=1 Tax=hydrothermal vent metagenome TaxID=652676 RepID=A0A3B0YD99_9ZZZZ
MLDESLVRNICLVAFDFDGVFTDDMVYVHQDGSESVRCFRGDGIGLQKLARLGIETVIISTEANPVVTTRAAKLKIRCIQNVGDKRAALEGVAKELGIALSQVVFVGNDINDLPALHCVGLPIVVSNAHPDVVRHATYQTRYSGGHGAVREVCDLIEKALVSTRAQIHAHL